MARRNTGPDPKEAALAEARCLNPTRNRRPPGVLVQRLLRRPRRDQVKYEMVRKLKAAAPRSLGRRGVRVLAALLLRGGRRSGALRAGGAGAGRPGPRGPRKLTEEILAWAEEQLAADRRSPGRLPDRSRSPSACARPPARTRERPPAAGSATPKAADLPAREMRKEDHPSLSLLPHLASGC